MASQPNRPNKRSRNLAAGLETLAENAREALKKQAARPERQQQPTGDAVVTATDPLLIDFSGNRFTVTPDEANASAYVVKQYERKLVFAPQKPVAAKRGWYHTPLVDKKTGENVLLPLGLTLVVGSTAAGKSEFSRRLVATGLFERLNLNEPFDTDGEIVEGWFSEPVDALSHAYALQVATAGAVVPIIDSLRTVVFETEGAAGAKGVVQRFFTMLTRVSNSLAAAGVRVVATVNPSETDDAYVESFMRKLSAAGPMVVELKGYDQGGYFGTYSSRASGRVSTDFVFPTNRPPSAAAAPSYAFPEPAVTGVGLSAASVRALSSTN